MKNQKKQGFSLIEIMVSLSIFAIVVVVATGALLSTIDATKKAQATQTVLTNLNLALEGMTRDIRSGSSYEVSDPQSFSFDEKNGGGRVNYSLVLESGKGVIKKQKGGSTEALTASEVDIQSLKFTKIGGSGNTQPRVFITARGVAGNKAKYQTTFEIQTTISQRKLNRGN